MSLCPKVWCTIFNCKRSYRRKIKRNHERRNVRLENDFNRLIDLGHRRMAGNGFDSIDADQIPVSAFNDYHKFKSEYGVGDKTNFEMDGGGRDGNNILRSSDGNGNDGENVGDSENSIPVYDKTTRF